MTDEQLLVMLLMDFNGLLLLYSLQARVPAGMMLSPFFLHLLLLDTYEVWSVDEKIEAAAAVLLCFCD